MLDFFPVEKQFQFLHVPESNVQDTKKAKTVPRLADPHRSGFGIVIGRCS